MHTYIYTPHGSKKKSHPQNSVLFTNMKHFSSPYTFEKCYPLLFSFQFLLLTWTNPASQAYNPWNTPSCLMAPDFASAASATRSWSFLLISSSDKLLLTVEGSSHLHQLSWSTQTATHSLVRVPILYLLFISFYMKDLFLALTCFSHQLLSFSQRPCTVQLCFLSNWHIKLCPIEVSESS